MTKCHSRLRALIAVLAAACGVALAAPAGGIAANPWTTPPNQFLNMAHQGGELEAPGNTLYAFKTALRDRGADAVEMDSYITSDGQLVISHDPTVNATTDFGQPTAAPPWNSGATSPYIWDHTLAELQDLDAAYWFSPGKGQYGHNPADPHPFRGIATGEVQAPAGYGRSDFQIPTFKDVLSELPPGTKINIDIKDQSGHTAEGIAAANELAAILASQPGGDNENVMVASFGSAEINAFHAAMPEHDSLSGSLTATQDYVLNNPSVPFDPQIEAIQPPDKYDLGGVIVDAPEVIKSVVERNGDDYAIHVWAADGTAENDALYRRLVDAGMQGFFPQEPSKLAAYLCANHVPDATGTPRCTPPAQPTGPIGRISKLKVKRKVKAGKKARVRGWINNDGDQAMSAVRACVEIPKRLRRKLAAKCDKVHGDVDAGRSAHFTIKVKTRRRARGNYKLAVAVSSENAGLQTGTVKLRVKPGR